MDQMTDWGKARFVLLAVMLGGCVIPAGLFRYATGLLLPSISVIGIADGLGTN